MTTLLSADIDQFLSINYLSTRYTSYFCYSGIIINCNTYNLNFPRELFNMSHINNLVLCSNNNNIKDNIINMQGVNELIWTSNVTSYISNNLSKLPKLEKLFVRISTREIHEGYFRDLSIYNIDTFIANINKKKLKLLVTECYVNNTTL